MPCCLLRRAALYDEPEFWSLCQPSKQSWRRIVGRRRGREGAWPHMCLPATQLRVPTSRRDLESFKQPAARRSCSDQPPHRRPHRRRTVAPLLRAARTAVELGSARPAAAQPRPGGLTPEGFYLGAPLGLFGSLLKPFDVRQCSVVGGLTPSLVVVPVTVGLTGAPEVGPKGA